MESKDLVQNTKSSSDYELADEMIENQMLLNDRLMCGGKSKRQLQELDNHIQTAEAKHDSVKMLWDYFKSLHFRNMHNQSENLLQDRSNSSFNDHKLILSQLSSQRDESDNLDYYNTNDDENMMEEASNANKIQVVITPRSPTKETQNCNEVPNLEIQVEESFENLDLNKHTKKAFKPKKKFNRIVDEPFKTSLINTGKKKRRKFHGRLKTSNSKSTVTTRETSFSDKKNDRRKFKKQKSLDTISVFQTPQFRKRISSLKSRDSNNSTSKNFVEIYHNNCLSGSCTAVSSRQSRTELAQVPQLEEEHKETMDDIEPKNVTVNDKSMETLLPTEPECKVEKSIKTEEQNQMQEGTYQPVFYDNFYQRNYEMPTMASKMKRVEHRHYHRFNIRHIPFVVGTSISPSHNLGLNIQQVLSIIKTKQPSVPGISPLLIRNVTKGIRPVSSLFEHITSEFAKSCRTLNIPDSNRSQRNNLRIRPEISSLSCEYLRNNTLSSTTNQTPFKQLFTCEPLYEEDEDTNSVYSSSRRHIEPTKQPLTLDNRLQSSRSKCQHPSRCSFDRQTRVTNSTKNAGGDLPGSHQMNEKEMVQVFKKLYNEFNRMITQQDKLKEQLEQRKDKALMKEVTEMEEAINAKQQEITTLVNLYKEVQALKKQMKLQHERNSFVCIASQDSQIQQIARTPKMLQREQTIGSIDCKSQKFFSNRSGFNMHEAPQALRLVGLLRQIQAFQRQLIMA